MEKRALNSKEPIVASHHIVFFVDFVFPENTKETGNGFYTVLLGNISENSE